MRTISLVVFSGLLLAVLSTVTSQNTENECGISSKDSIMPLRRKRDVHFHGKAESPWLAIIYKQKEGKWEQLCSGILVSSHIVLTAAHCMVVLDVKTDPRAVRVGLGKTSREFEVKEDSAVIAMVREVVLPELFLGEKTYYALDLALLDLTSNVKISKHVMPACFTWGKSLPVQDNELGQVNGWWKTSNGTVSENILSAKLPVLNPRTCIDSVREVLKRLITHDKFCAKPGTGEGKSIGPPASGIGMTIVRDGRHHAIGILSTKIFPGNVLLFSDLSNPQHREWLQEQKTRLDKISH